MSDKKKFVEMVDSGAMLKGFMKTFGISKTQFNEHLANVGYYRKYIEVSNQISEIRRGGGSAKDILKLRLELKQIMEEEDE